MATLESFYKFLESGMFFTLVLLLKVDGVNSIS